MATETRERITDPERLSRLEGAHMHMATKADLAALETRLTALIAESDEKRAASEARVMTMVAESEIRLTEKILKSENRLIKWGVGIAVTAFAAAASLVAAGIMVLYRLLSS